MIMSGKLYEKCSGCFAAFSSAADRIASCRNGIRAGTFGFAVFRNNTEDDIELIHNSSSQNTDLEAAAARLNTPNSASPPRTPPKNPTSTISPPTLPVSLDEYESSSSDNDDNDGKDDRRRR